MEFFPYTQFVSSTQLRKHVNENPIGYINFPGLGKFSMPETNTLSILYDEIKGGIWVSFSIKPYLVTKEQYPPEVPNIGIMPKIVNNCKIGNGIEELCKLKVWVFSITPPFITDIVNNCSCNDDEERLIVNIPHGRSGKSDFIIDENYKSNYSFGNFKIKDYYFDIRGYISFDKWLKNPENTFKNPIPSNEKPKVLVAASWNSSFRTYQRLWTIYIQQLINLNEFDVVSINFLCTIKRF